MFVSFACFCVWECVCVCVCVSVDDFFMSPHFLTFALVSRILRQSRAGSRAVLKGTSWRLFGTTRNPIWFGGGADQGWALEVFLNFFTNKKLFFAFFIKLI